MTGKELTMALLGAAVVGGAAGAAASIVAAPKAEPAAAEPSPEIACRLKSAEDELAKTQLALDDSKRSINELTERVTVSELKAARASGGVSAAPATGRTIRAGRGAHAAPGDVQVEGLGPDTFELGDAGGDMAIELGNALEGLKGEIGGLGVELGSLQAGMELRKC